MKKRLIGPFDPFRNEVDVYGPPPDDTLYTQNKLSDEDVKNNIKERTQMLVNEAKADKKDKLEILIFSIAFLPFWVFLAYAASILTFEGSFLPIIIVSVLSITYLILSIVHFIDSVNRLKCYEAKLDFINKREEIKK